MNSDRAMRLAAAEPASQKQNTFKVSEHGADGAAILDILLGQMFRLNFIRSKILELPKQASTASEIADRLTRQLSERQIKVLPLVLSRAEIRDLASQVVDALAQLRGTDIPSALGHLDLHPQNVIVSPVGAVFFDWAEGFVGHPFLTLQYFLEHFRRAFGDAHTQEASSLTITPHPGAHMFQTTTSSMLAR